MAEAEHPKGTPDNPLTRDDVLRCRDEFVTGLEARLAAGDKLSEVELTLNFSSKTFQKQIDLENVEFAGVVTRGDRLVVWHTNFQGARLVGANLQQANVWRANLQGAHLVEANLQGAHLVEANLQGAHLMESNLQGAYLWGANIRQANLWRANLQGSHLSGWQEAQGLEDVHWGNYVLGEELYSSFGVAAETYRELKVWHTQRGLYDRAGEFFYREMECKRKGTSFRQNPGQWLWLNLLWGPLGYGEKPGRVVGYGVLVWLLFAAAYWAAGLFWGLVTPDFLFAFYLSAVSFTAVGYGPWIAATAAQGWAQGLARLRIVRRRLYDRRFRDYLRPQDDEMTSQRIELIKRISSSWPGSGPMHPLNPINPLTDYKPCLLRMARDEGQRMKQFKQINRSWLGSGPMHPFNPLNPLTDYKPCLLRMARDEGQRMEQFKQINRSWPGSGPMHPFNPLNPLTE